MNTVNKTILEFAPNVNIQRLEILPVVGATMLAAESINQSLPDTFVSNLPEELCIPNMF
jgi:hypothetical protein